MKKLLQYILITVFLVTTTSCTKKEAEIFTPENSSIYETTYLEKPKNQRPRSQEPIDNIFIALNTLKQADYYESETYGEIDAKKKIKLTTQTLNNSRIITPNATFSELTSISTFVKAAEQFYITNDKAIKREAKKVTSNSTQWSNQVSTLTHEQFIQTYGYLPSDPIRYIINKDTIIDDIEIIANGIGRKYTYKFNLDPKIATKNYSINVKTIANSTELPQFNSIEVTMTFDYKWRMTKIITKEEYTITMKGLGKVTCLATLTETFKNINRQINIQEKDFFNTYL